MIYTTVQKFKFEDFFYIKGIYDVTKDCNFKYLFIYFTFCLLKNPE